MHKVYVFKLSFCRRHISRKKVRLREVIKNMYFISKIVVLKAMSLFFFFDDSSY